MSQESGWILCDLCSKPIDVCGCFCLNCNELVKECGCAPDERIWPNHPNQGRPEKKTLEGRVQNDVPDAMYARVQVLLEEARAQMSRLEPKPVTPKALRGPDEHAKRQLEINGAQAGLAFVVSIMEAALSDPVATPYALRVATQLVNTTIVHWDIKHRAKLQAASLLMRRCMSSSTSDV